MPFLLKPEEIVEIGQVVRKHGYQGSCKVHTDVDLKPVQHALHWLFLFFDDKPVPYGLESLTVQSPETILVKLQGIEDETQLKSLLERAVGIHRQLTDQLHFTVPELDHYLGYEVVDERTGKTLGTLQYVDYGTQQPLATIDTGKRTWLMPLPTELIVDVQQAHHRIRVSVPEGLELL